MTKKEKKEKKEETSFDFGAMGMSLGGFFKGLERLVEFAGKVAEKGEEIKKEGEIKGLGKDVRGVYGFSIRTLAGKPVIERFGNIKKTPEGPRLEEEREPMVDVFDERDHVLVVAEMPGVEKEDVDIEIKEGHLFLKAQKGKRKYSKVVKFPAAVDESTVSSSYKNGILEIRLVKKNGKG